MKTKSLNEIFSWNASTYCKMNKFKKISNWLLLNQACIDITSTGVRKMNDELHDVLLIELTKSMKVEQSIDPTKVDETELRMIINDFKGHKMREVICTFILHVFGIKSNMHLWREGLMAHECLVNFAYSCKWSDRIGTDLRYYIKIDFIVTDTINHLTFLFLSRSVNSVNEKRIVELRNLLQSICSLHVKSNSRLGLVIKSKMDKCIKKVQMQKSKYNSNIKQLICKPILFSQEVPDCFKLKAELPPHLIDKIDQIKTQDEEILFPKKTEASTPSENQWKVRKVSIHKFIKIIFSQREKFISYFSGKTGDILILTELK